MNHARQQVGHNARDKVKVSWQLRRPTCLRAWFMVCSLSNMKGYITHWQLYPA